MTIITGGLRNDGVLRETHLFADHSECDFCDKVGDTVVLSPPIPQNAVVICRGCLGLLQAELEEEDPYDG
ncbi:MAG: hypothetical protein C4534_02125 [Gaiellales bacterium]|nr:MAG: hypothetical protein C4534_02125 [Gaiellales bacterium]